MRFAWLLLPLSIPIPAAAQAPVAVLAPDTETRWVAFDLTPGNQVRFTMTVNGRPAVAVLDTGVSATIVSRNFAAMLGLRPVTGGSADAIGGPVPVGWTAIESLSVGGFTRTGGRLAVTELKAIATGGTSPVDMLVGSDLLGKLGLEIDYDARRFRLLPSGRLPFVGKAVPLRISPGSGVFASEATIAGRRVRPMIVDTGDGSAITLSRAAWTATGAVPPRVTSAYAVGLGGAIETELTVLPSLKLASLTARNVELRIEDGAGFSALTKTAGRIGSGFLQRYRVLLDPSAGRMVLAPGRTVDREPLKSTSGLLVAYDGDALTVLHVMRNSPAASTGWRAGDRICTIDGAAVPKDYAASPIARWTIGDPSRIVKLGLCGGGDRSLTLARFY